MENMLSTGKIADIMKLQKFAMSKTSGGTFRGNQGIKAEYVPEEIDYDAIAVELFEAPKYDLYHKDFSSAMQHAYKMAKKLHGITVDPKEIDDKVASGPKKPSSGKTNSYRLKGDKGAIQVQVYNMDNKKYELNMYKEEVELDESEFSAMAYGKKDQRFIVKPRDIRGMAGKQDKFKMYVAKLDNRGNEKEIIKDLGTHISLDSAIKFAKNNKIIEDVELDERIDPADIDMDATDDDIKSADKNIMMQMRKVQSLKGNYAVEFMNGKKQKIDPKIAMAVQAKYLKMRRPAEKEMFQSKISKSYKDMLSALKEGFSSDAQRKAAFASGYKEKGKKKKEEVEIDEGTKQVLAHGGKGKYKVTKDGDKIEIKFGGKVVGTADFDRGADSFFVSMKGEKGQKSFDDAQAIADYFAKNKITEDKSTLQRISQKIQERKNG
tara:strand:- start:2518 stop:3822 length:1305 start_codon:yes stop_codon:yes gene_type:complete